MANSGILRLDIILEDGKNEPIILHAVLNKSGIADLGYEHELVNFNLSSFSEVHTILDTQTNTTQNSTVYFETGAAPPYDNVGALTFVIVVILVYGISMFLLLGALAKRKSRTSMFIIVIIIYKFKIQKKMQYVLYDFLNIR